MISFIGVIFIPILIVGIFLTNELRQNALDEAMDDIALNLDRVIKRSTEILKVPVYISNNIQFDAQLAQLVNTEFQSTFDVFTAYRNYNDFQYYQQTYPIIENIHFLMHNPTMLNSWSFIPVDMAFMQTEWYQETVDANGLILWKYIASPIKNGRNLTLIRKINFLDYKTHGVLVIPIDTNQINWILEQEVTPTFMIDDENYIVASNQPEHIGSHITELIDEPIADEQYPNTIKGHVRGESSYISSDQLVTEGSKNHLKVISIVSEREILNGVNKIGFIGAATTLIGVLMAVILIMGVSWLISKRLAKLSSEIQRVGKGQLDTMIPIDGKDEIGQLSLQFNQMVENIRLLIQEVQETNRQKNLMENQQNAIKFKMLASQINPHFLFNTLESIRMKSHIQGEKEIARVVKTLGKLMRKQLEVEGKKITIEEELEVVRYYLEIQQFRFGDRLHFTVHVDKDIDKALIYPLTIQPLVENAVIHGLEHKEIDGYVHIHIQRQEDAIHVSIEDNGVGMDEEKLLEVKQNLDDQNEKEGVRIGLRNVHQRLILTYGPQSGLNIASTVNQGTIVQFTIPLEV